ncbi:hypothetical protein OIU74_003781 [Salix koriyanagi]|uniref:Uncharacterized protein n=1 Tax=Salix koriyanagi TaxID=2511006 RepID=A0A9Q0ZLJ5_9ROSI|nr:hypothetical protein OIU74_003781 [Salix koriyanagi]
MYGVLSSRVLVPETVKKLSGLESKNEIHIGISCRRLSVLMKKGEYLQMLTS